MSVKTGCGVFAVDPGVDGVAVVGDGWPLAGVCRCRATQPPTAMPTTARMTDAAIAPPPRLGEASGGGGLVEWSGRISDGVVGGIFSVSNFEDGPVTYETEPEDDEAAGGANGIVFVLLLGSGGNASPSVESESLGAGGPLTRPLGPVVGPTGRCCTADTWVLVNTSVSLVASATPASSLGTMTAV